MVDETVLPPPAATIEMIGVVSRIDRLTLIDGVTLALPPGRILAVTGPAGCGKSALLNLMSTLILPTVGDLRLFGQDTAAICEDGRRRLRLEIGMVFNEGGLLDGFTVAENIELPLVWRGMASIEVARRTESWLVEFQLTPYRDIMVRDLSVALVRRVALARALAPEPRLLICDELSIGLDLRAVRAFQRMFRRLRGENGTTIVLATNDLAEINVLADLVAVLDRGRLLFYGDTMHLRGQCAQDPILREIFDDESWSVYAPPGLP
ncbi:MAG: ATP-binding cassette domain-containing protein [Azospirillum sp.]|nr:ATP-binding cassette domain-containing protein [Azospirillum sp.]